MGFVGGMFLSARRRFWREKQKKIWFFSFTFLRALLFPLFTQTLSLFFFLKFSFFIFFCWFFFHFICNCIHFSLLLISKPTPFTSLWYVYLLFFFSFRSQFFFIIWAWWKNIGSKNSTNVYCLVLSSWNIYRALMRYVGWKSWDVWGSGVAEEEQQEERVWTLSTEKERRDLKVGRLLFVNYTFFVLN